MSAFFCTLLIVCKQLNRILNLCINPNAVVFYFSAHTAMSEM